MNKTKAKKHSEIYDVIVVGGGAAGMGIAITLGHAGIDNFTVLERDKVGASFAAWPAETRFITPSFPSNSIGMLDLNAIAIGVSPAYSLEVEHPTGEEYASHLRAVAKHFKIPVKQQSDVRLVSKVGDEFHIQLERQMLRAKHVVWAAGEFQYPRLNGFLGSEHCRHTATVPSYEDISGDNFIIIGGYESGVDAAYHLAYQDKKVRLFDSGCPWTDESSDPSIALSTYSQERMREDWFKEHVELFPESPVASVSVVDGGYEVVTTGGNTFHTPCQPLLAGGFEGSQKTVAHLFEKRDDGFLLLSEQDESTIVSGIYLCGPAVRHDNQVFCFIYKYRQRFAVVAKSIATSLGLAAEDLEQYRQWGMYLDDLSCCGEECATC